MSRRIMVVDDDASIRETLATHFAEGGFDVVTAASSEEALSRIGAFDPALLVTDVRMAGMNGLELLAKVRAVLPDVHVVVMTAFEEMESAIAAMKGGAFEYLVKPLDLDQIDLVVERAVRDQAARRRVQQLTGEEGGPYALSRLVGRDARMIEIYKTIGAVARSRAPVLIRGETGTGKEVIARAIHFNSDDAAEPFVAVNCTALPETLLESELFGHLKGAFTGATADRKGRFELAGRGTIFLDEIGDTSPAFQSKLLRVLQEHELQPVGAERARRTEARVLAATHRPLEALVREGKFREDLYYRLRVVEITVPPLRERRADIPLLADYLLAKAAREMHRAPAALTADALRALAAYDWPGNVRELENTLARALVLARGATIGAEELALGERGAAPASAESLGELESLEAVERAHIARVMQRVGGNKRKACRVLRISRPRLDRLLEKYEIAVSGRDRG